MHRNENFFKKLKIELNSISKIKSKAGSSHMFAERAAKLHCFGMAMICSIWSQCSFAIEAWTCKDTSVPAGAIEIGATQPFFQDCPQLKDLDFTGADGKKYYNGVWYGKPKDRSFYEYADDGIIIKVGAEVATVKLNSYRGFFPFLKGDRPFYIEAQVTVSSNDMDNFPAIWLMPIEHNFRLDDVYPPDPKGFERWFELDIDEGGFGPGGHNTAISWVGKWPDYVKTQNANPSSKDSLDRRLPNVYGVSYSPETLSVRWWLNGKKVLEATRPYVSDIARKQRFYLIISAQSHHNISNYQMKFMGVRAFVGEPIEVRN